MRTGEDIVWPRIFYVVVVVVIKCFMIGVNVWWVYLAPQNIPRAVNVLTLGNKVILYCIVLEHIRHEDRWGHQSISDMRTGEDIRAYQTWGQVRTADMRTGEDIRGHQTWGQVKTSEDTRHEDRWGHQSISYMRTGKDIRGHQRWGQMRASDITGLRTWAL